MERTSIITRLMLAKASSYPLISLTNGLPDAGSLTTFFTTIPHVTERADFQQRTEDTPQGDVENITIRATIHREALTYMTFVNTRIIAYIETSNGEKHLLGSNAYPFSFSYERDSGAGNSDDRFTIIRMNMTKPVE